MKHQHLHIVHATEQAIARPDVFRSQEQNVRLIGNGVIEAAGLVIELRRARERHDLAAMEAACTALGIQLRAAERLREEIEIALEQATP